MSIRLTRHVTSRSRVTHSERRQRVMNGSNGVVDLIGEEQHNQAIDSSYSENDSRASKRRKVATVSKPARQNSVTGRHRYKIRIPLFEGEGNSSGAKRKPKICIQEQCLPQVQRAFKASKFGNKVNRMEIVIQVRFCYKKKTAGHRLTPT